jgi:hypothetical protein
LEAEAAQGTVLSYVGAPTVRARLEQKGMKRIPSKATIERVLRAAGMTRPKQTVQTEETKYPRLNPPDPNGVQQIDIVPHFLPGGQAVACFNALDVVSRYPFGQPFLRKRSVDAMAFLLNLWREVGVAEYTQFDNESCFCGGHRHPYVLGRVVRLCLRVGTQPVFTPFYHPKSNAHVERFHQEYNRHVWDRHYLDTLETVNAHSQPFFHAYRRQHHPDPLKGLSPQHAHGPLAHRLPADFDCDLDALPLTEGQVHFIRQVRDDGTIRVLNVDWTVPTALPQQGVWATLALTVEAATLLIYDNAPDVPNRKHLVSHPFPLREPVLPLLAQFRRQSSTFSIKPWLQRAFHVAQWLSTMF